MGRTHRVRGTLEYLGYRALARTLRVLPARADAALARLSGGAALRLGVGRRVTLANLELAFPALARAEREALARESYRHFARNVLELLRSERWSEPELRPRVEFVERRREAATRPLGPGDLLHPDPATGAVHAPRRIAQPHRIRSERQMPPAPPGPAVVAGGAAPTLAAAQPPPAARLHRDLQPRLAPARPRQLYAAADAQHASQ
jgi:hypothetical protein